MIENIYFLVPLLFPGDQPRRVRLFVETGDNTLKVSLKSQAISADEDSDSWEEHSRAIVHLEDPSEHPTVDLNTITKNLPRQLEAGALYNQLSGKDERYADYGVRWGERWNSATQLIGGDDEWMVTLELPQQFAGDLDQFMFHPALVDVAFSSAMTDLSAADYLPFSYRRVRLCAPIKTRSVFCHLRLAHQYNSGDDTVIFDITVYDPDGNVLMEVERYSLKHLGDLTEGGSAEQTATEVAPENTATPNEVLVVNRPDYILPPEGMDAFGRVMTASFMPQVIISPRDMSVLLDEEFEFVKKRIERRSMMAEETAAAKPAHPRPSLSTPYVAPENEIEIAIAEIWQGVLGIDQIGLNDSFTELGGNSLLAVQTVANISETFQGELPMDAFTGDSTISSLSATVLEVLVGMTSDENLEELLASLDE